jgi:toxin ParE1/3/4
VKVRITAEAEAELEKIADHIAKDSPDRALTFVDELLDAALAIGSFPKAYPLIPRYEHYGYRRRVFGFYLIIYAIETDHVVVTHFLHGARDFETFLFPDS